MMRLKLENIFFVVIEAGQFQKEKIIRRKSQTIRKKLFASNSHLIMQNHCKPTMKKIIFITHYPPFNNKQENSEYTKLLSEYKVYKVVFGHLHNYINPNMRHNNIDGVQYYLTSCDAVKNELVEID